MDQELSSVTWLQNLVPYIARTWTQPSRPITCLIVLSSIVNLQCLGTGLCKVPGTKSLHLDPNIVIALISEYRNAWTDGLYMQWCSKRTKTYKISDLYLTSTVLSVVFSSVFLLEWLTPILVQSWKKEFIPF